MLFVAFAFASTPVLTNYSVWREVPNSQFAAVGEEDLHSDRVHTTTQIGSPAQANWLY